MVCAVIGSEPFMSIIIVVALISLAGSPHPPLVCIMLPLLPIFDLEEYKHVTPIHHKGAPSNPHNCSTKERIK